MNENTQELKIKKILKDAFLLYRSNFSIFLAISVLAYTVTLFEQLLTSLKIFPGWFGFIASIAGFVLSIWANVALIFAAAERYRGNDVSVKEAFSAATSKIWRFFSVSVFYSVIVILGLLLLIIPAFYVGTIFALAGIVMVLENSGFFEAFKRSKAIVRGYFWQVFLLFLFVFVMLIPFQIVYLLNINTTVKIFLSLSAMILTAPFYVAVEINLYYKLLKIKDETYPVESQETEKGVGGLGCLSLIGLMIAIAVLTPFYLRSLGNFIRSEKGNQYYEQIARKVSPEIVFPGGVSLLRPKGYLVLKSGDKPVTYYSFFGSRVNDFFSFKAFSISLKDLGIEDKTAITLGDGVIWDKYFDYWIKQTPSAEKIFSDMEKQPVKLLPIAGNTWGECKLMQKGKTYSESHKAWTYLYTLSKQDVIFISYGHKDVADKEKLLRKAQEIKNILEKMRFPED